MANDVMTLEQVVEKIKGITQDVTPVRDAVEKISKFETLLEAKGVDITDLKDLVKTLGGRADQLEADIKKGLVVNGKGEIKTVGEHIAELVIKSKDAIEKSHTGGKINLRFAFEEKAVADMTVANNLTGAIPNTYRAEMVPTPFDLIHFRSLVAVTHSDTDSYHFYRHNVGEGTIDYQANEDAAKNQIDEDLSEVTVNLNTLAGFLNISKKMMRNFKALRSYLSRWLPERYYQAEDGKAYAALKAGATGVAATAGNIFDRIIKTIGSQKQAKYGVNGIVVNGNTWADLLIIKATGSGEYNSPGVVSVTPNGQILILGIPVYTATWVADNEAIVGDWRMYEIIQSEGLSLGFFEQDVDNVRKNKVTARIEATIGFALLDPKAFAFVDTEEVVEEVEG